MWQLDAQGGCVARSRSGHHQIAGRRFSDPFLEQQDENNQPILWHKIRRRTVNVISLARGVFSGLSVVPRASRKKNFRRRAGVR